MYRKVYRQEGGLSNLGSEAFMRQEVDKSLAKFKQRSRNVGQQARSRPVPIPSPIIPQHPRDKIPQRIKEGFSSLIQDPIPNYNPMAEMLFKTIDAPEIARLEMKHGPGYTGKPSDARHQAGSHEMRKSISDLLQKANLNMAPKAYTDFIGNLTTNVVGAGKEGLSYLYNTLNLWDDVSEKEARDMGVEDLKANWAGTFGIPTGEDMTPEQIYEKVYNPNKEAALQYGDIEAQVEANRLRQDVNPLDYKNKFNFRRNYLSDYIQADKDQFNLDAKDEGNLGSYTYISEVSPGTQQRDPTTGKSLFDPQRYSEYQKASDEADRIWGYRNNPQQASAFQPVATQPTGGFGPSPDLFNRPIMPEGFVPPPEVPGVQQQANAFQKVNNEVLKPVQEQQQGLPSLMKIVDEQRNPTPVVPSNATGFKSKADAMADHNEKYRGGMVNVYQNADGSWSYQPPYDLDSPPARPLGLPITPGGPAL